MRGGYYNDIRCVLIPLVIYIRLRFDYHFAVAETGFVDQKEGSEVLLVLLDARDHPSWNLRFDGLLALVSMNDTRYFVAVMVLFEDLGIYA
jgi:hypothetical protein